MMKSKLHRDGHYIDVTLFEVQGIRARVSSSIHTIYVRPLAPSAHDISPTKRFQCLSKVVPHYLEWYLCTLEE